MRSRYLRSLARQSHRLFNTRQTPLNSPILRRFSQNTRLNQDEKIIPFTYLVGAGVIGGIIALTYGSGSLHWNNDVIGAPAPATAKELNHPDRRVWTATELVRGAIGDGGEGRSCPGEVSIVHGGTTLRGYCKNPANGRIGLLNELVYHEFAQKVMPGHHPQIKLIETPRNETESTYELFIESIGDNANLLQHCKRLAEDPETISSGTLEHLGCAMAFAMLILSADNFMKNFVVINKTQHHGSVYPIDFEVLDRSKIRNHAIDYIDLNKKPIEAITSFLANGGLLDYKENFSFTERLREQSGAEDTADIGKGWSIFGKSSRIIYHFIVKNAAQDISNGHIKTMYHNIAALDEQAIDRMLQPYIYLMTEAERQDYKDALLEIVQQTREFISKLEPSPGMSL